MPRDDVPPPPIRWNSAPWTIRTAEAKGLTLEQVAKAAGTTNQQVSKLEKGERGLDLDWLARIARGLGCEPWELLPPTLSLPRDAADLVRAYASLTPAQKNLVRRLVREMTKTRG